MNVKLHRVLLVASIALATASAYAQTTISDPSLQFRAGIDIFGNLYNSTSNVGIQRVVDGYDAIQPGTPREAWGISAGVTVGYADPNSAGILNLVLNGPMSSTANTAFSSTFLNGGAGNLLRIDQAYSFLNGINANILQITETVTNVSGGPLPVEFARNVDFDILPTQFSEFTFATPSPGPYVLDGTYGGFENPSPLVPYLKSVTPAGSTHGPDDNGGGFKLSLGVLNPGESASFKLFEGLNRIGETPFGVTTQVQGLGATYGIIGYGNDGTLFSATHSAGLAVGPVTIVPEPSSLVFALFGLAGLGAVAVRRHRQCSLRNQSR